MNNFEKSNLENQKVMSEELEIKKRRVRNTLNTALNRYFGLVIAVVVLAILSVSYVYFIKPQYDSIVKNVNESFFEKNQLLPKYREADSYKNILKAYKLVDANDIKRVNDMIPDEYIKEDLFTELVYIVAHNGFTVNSLDITKYSDSVKPAASSDSVRRSNDKAATPTAASTTTSTKAIVPALPNGVGAMTAKLDVSDLKYKDFLKLLNILEENLRLLDINSVSFNPGNNSAVFNFSTYYLKK